MNYNPEKGVLCIWVIKARENDPDFFLDLKGCRVQPFLQVRLRFVGDQRLSREMNKP